jgi:hypothetical protein
MLNKTNSQLAGYQIGILRGARSNQLRCGFIKQNEIFEKLQELKAQSEIFTNQ